LLGEAMQAASKANVRPASSARITAGQRHPPEPEAVAETHPGPEPAGPSQATSIASPTMIARTDTKATTAATHHHHSQSPRWSLPAGITPRTLAAVGKPRLKAGNPDQPFFLNRRQKIRECLSTSQLVQNVGLFLSQFRTLISMPGTIQDTHLDARNVGLCASSEMWDAFALRENCASGSRNRSGIWL
jgi:hypothetical protein